MDAVTLALAKSYTNNSLGAVSTEVNRISAQAQQSANDIVWIVTLHRSELPAGSALESGSITLLKCVRSVQIVGVNVVPRLTGSGLPIASGAPSVVVGTPSGVCIVPSDVSKTAECMQAGNIAYVENGVVKLNCGNRSYSMNFDIKYETVD